MGAVALRSLLLALLVASLLLATSRAQPAVKVVVTAPTLEAVVRAVGGDRVKVSCVIPPGADPHHYEPTLEDLKALRAADIVVMTGPSHLPIEERVEELASAGEIEAVLVNYRDYVEYGLRLLELPSGKVNPHGYMFSCSGLGAIARAVEKALEERDQGGAGYYRARLSAFLERLKGACEAARRVLGREARVALLTPMLQYVAEDLGLRVELILLPELGVEPAPGDVDRLVEAYRLREIELVLLTDREASEYSGLLEELRRRDVPYVIVPLFSSRLIEEPETIPLVVASWVRCGRVTGYRRAGCEWLAPPLAASVGLNAALIPLVALLIAKVRGVGR